MIFELFRWWYGAGWRKIARNITAGPAAVERNFSVVILLDTLFAPWKRMTTAQGRSLDAKVQAMIDNAISRFVGFFVRLFVLLAAMLSILGTALVTLVIALVWPFVPLLIIACAVDGIIG